MVSRVALALSLLAVPLGAASQTTSRGIAETADLSGLTASPDGQWLAYRVERPSTTTNRIDVDWYVVAAHGHAAPRALGRTGEAWWDDAGVVVGGEAKWSSDSKRLVVRALVDGRISLWSTSPEGSGFRETAGGAGDVEAFAFAPDARLIVKEGPSRDLIAKAEDGERLDGIYVDGTVDLGQPLYRGALINGRQATQRFSNDWFDRAPLLAGAPRAFSSAGSDGDTRPATEAEIALLVPEKHPALLGKGDLPEGLARAAAQQDICLERIGCAVESLRLSWSTSDRNGSHYLAVHDASFRQTIYRLAPGQNRLVRMASSDGQLSGGRYYFQPCAAAGPALFCVEAAPAVPPRLVRIDSAGKRRVVDSPNPNPDSDGLLAETLAWQVSGSRASGILIRPKIPGRLPLFVTYYRCNGYLRGGVGDEWPLRALAANGIAALCINGLPSAEGGTRRYQAGLDVVKSAVDMLAARGLIDPDEVGMGGLSFGSEVTMWAATHSKLLKAVSIASVQMEPGYYWFNARPGRETFSDNVRKVWGLGSPDESPSEWSKVSAALNADKIDAPVLMQLPEQEARLSVELLSKLATRRMGEMHIFPMAPHIKVEPRQKLAAYQRNLDWFRFWLKGEIDPDPAKREQYRRWRQLGQPVPASTALTQRSTSAISINRK
ncbi:Atxe2 family lasso peptide isopeptidase [Sphingopyxis sp. SCN 67-31]|uniref:Atxe2 family lasso peptide isopeptidase n=1 Tax=Sphingopyxis sp. SCN 67-31 TaxID=1660142 RepID=UPI00086B986F|nr:Atxe2 family lasso peptide isopeptidase [Sphingopyxis sp. SCN 67-31]ODU35106.1 MAG: hypothetical protein ABS88_01395 [Sphingopyxis sp. SCN 67-31]